MKKCIGCGIELQNENVLNTGYTPNLENDLCMRCFKVKHYGETSVITKNKMNTSLHQKIKQEMNKTEIKNKLKVILIIYKLKKHFVFF